MANAIPVLVLSEQDAGTADRLVDDAATKRGVRTLSVAGTHVVEMSLEALKASLARTVGGRHLGGFFVHHPDDLPEALDSRNHRRSVSTRGTTRPA